MESGAGGSPKLAAVFVRKNKEGFEMRDVTGKMQYVFAAMGGALGDAGAGMGEEDAGGGFAREVPGDGFYGDYEGCTADKKT